ncbi:hypothetical protein DFJ69_2997 [Thermomonospora umbrina]|uniref:Uncharacterized protein n=2 Tax=Thermomonospora umbrina TaxID=111806 RepID=A0A3D9SY84_9ACTN|nr:hypothetical protein DFJ69_2997 [Thermomonospora umbrina]
MEAADVPPGKPEPQERPEPTARPSAEPESEPESEATPEAGPGPTPKTNPEAEPKADARPGLKPGTEPEAEVVVEAGREMVPVVVVLALAVGAIGLVAGAVLVVASLAGWSFGAWDSATTVTPGVVGAAMVRVAPGLFAVGAGAGTWEEARALVWPLVVVVGGQAAVNVVEWRSLVVVEGGPVLAFFFSLGWFAVFAVLAIVAVAAVIGQYAEPTGPDLERRAPLPAWSKPPIAVLGSAWFGIGSGLLVLPGYWSAFVPWTVNRMDARSLGLWAVALGVALLGALAEDDLHRIRPALTVAVALPVALAVVLAAHADEVRWGTGPALALVAMTVGLLLSGTIGRLLARRSDRRDRGSSRVLSPPATIYG